MPGYESFVGQYPIPMRHGMTIGELAQLFNAEFGIGAELEVVPMDGWRRDMYFDATGLPWVMPSPNMPTLDTARRLSRQRAVRGHERVGRARHDPAVRARGRAVGRSPSAFAEDMNRAGLPGVRFRPAVFEPTFQKHARTACGGCQMHVLDRQAFTVRRRPAWR